MLRNGLTAIGVVELLFPETLIQAAEQIALDNPNECELRSWVAPGARVEGLAILFVMWRSDDSYSAFKRFLGLVGVLALVAPQAYVDYGAALAYTDAADCKWRDWVYSGTRLVGLLYVLVAVAERRAD
ncbi:hypothetical protein [Haloarcula amylovorans]|uniref:hypothetical protein n=1 Tax=Haloarcula amylovorans TaxID=2562280 RepID=UPI001075D540|nr:hypothetical protein [Halomicroarcula amylolytica]